MADKKTTKKTAKVEAPKTVAELRQDLLTARKSLHDGTLSNPHAIKAIKKQIARALTAENAAGAADNNKKGTK